MGQNTSMLPSNSKPRSKHELQRLLLAIRHPSSGGNERITRHHRLTFLLAHVSSLTTRNGVAVGQTKPAETGFIAIVFPLSDSSDCSLLNHYNTGDQHAS